MADRQAPRGESGYEELTWREMEVLGLLAKHLTNQEIASRLHLAESTVKDYVSRILSKLYVKNRRQAVTRAKELGLLDGEPKAKSKPASNLPAEATPFIGRRLELGEIKRQLSNTRLLTLSGPGGIGKTRLALKTAQEETGHFRDGCHFISLAPIPSSARIAQAIAQALKIPQATQEEPRRQLLRYLRKRELLLVLDNFEHLLDGVTIVSEIIQAAPAIKVLVTSRERLNIMSETNLVIGGMAVPESNPASYQSEMDDTALDKAEYGQEIDHYDAISLFIQSANKVQAGYYPSAEELVLITRICQAVGGLPLAIELAAAWLQILTVSQIVSELDKGLDILSAEVRDAPARHRSIHAVFDYSWSLLSLKEQEKFLQLSVFRGGFTHEAAEEVTGASLAILAGLANKSLLSHDLKSGRLEIHELLRQYAQERLDQSQSARQRTEEAHAVFYADFMYRQGQELKGRRQMSALAAIETDLENIRKAWDFELTRKNSTQIEKFTIAFWLLHWSRGWNLAATELFGALFHVFAEIEGEEALSVRAQAMACQSYFMGWLNQADEGFQLAHQAVVILQDIDKPEALLLAMDSLIINAFFLERYQEQYDWIDKMLEAAAEFDDFWFISLVLYAASLGALNRRDFGEASRLAEENLEICQKRGDRFLTTTSLIARGHSEYGIGKFAEARKYYRRCLEIAQEIGFHYSLQTSSKYLAKANIFLCNYREAERYLVQCLALTKEAGFVRDIVNLLYEFAHLHAAQDRSLPAVKLLALVLEQPASYEARMLEGRIRDSALTLLAEIERDLPADIFQAALEEGRQLEIDTVVGKLLSQEYPGVRPAAY